jgi:hypothetical protein
VRAVLMHEPRAWPHERLIHFHRPVATHLGDGASLHRLPNPMQHEPCGLLSNFDPPRQFVTADAVLAVANHPERRHPLVHAQRRILENRSHLQGELLFAAVAEPNAAGLDEGMLFGTATGAVDPGVGPAKLDGVAKSPLGIGEVNDGLLKRFRLFHKKMVPQTYMCVKYILAFASY